MISVRKSLLLILLSLSFLNAQELQTSSELTNFEVITDIDCDRVLTNTQEPKEVVEPEIQEVETVNYKLGGKVHVVSFPVTVRSNKKGE